MLANRRPRNSPDKSAICHRNSNRDSHSSRAPQSPIANRTHRHCVRRARVSWPNPGGDAWYWWRCFDSMSPALVCARYFRRGCFSFGRNCRWYHRHQSNLSYCCDHHSSYSDRRLELLTCSGCKWEGLVDQISSFFQMKIAQRWYIFTWIPVSSCRKGNGR